MKGLDIIYNNEEANLNKKELNAFTLKEAQTAFAYHKTIPQYNETPLITLKALAKHYELACIFVKDESFRFGLNSFKALGGSFAIGKILAKKLKLNALDFNEIIKHKDKIRDLILTTATDGNHGRGVAWTAEQFGLKSIIYMPKGSSEERIKNIEKHGAIVKVTDFNYDDTVKIVREDALKNGWVIVQDTAWEHYEEVPLWIMQGYLTLAYECYEKLLKENVVPTHIFIQAGVGALAGSVAAFFSQIYREQPKIIIIEPVKAACFYESIKNLKPTKVSGDLNTIMAGLACGEVNPIGWEILKKIAKAIIKCEDYLSANGMRILSSPLNGDTRIISGESGAVPIGVLDSIMRHKFYSDMREKLMLNENSKILMFSTEGATDFENYKNIVWYGRYYDPIK
jgi:diaminopropionate ammonia-lyase